MSSSEESPLDGEEEENTLKCLKKLFMSQFNNTAASATQGDDAHANPRDDTRDDNQSKTALLVLNAPIYSKSLFESLWKISHYRIFADGGANRVYDLYKEDDGDGKDEQQQQQDQQHVKRKRLKRTDLLPDEIHGDLDSIRPEVKQWYETQSVVVSRYHYDYSTDFGKAIDRVKRHFGSTAADIPVIVVGSVAGRVDQGIGLLAELYRIEKEHSAMRLWLASEASISFIVHSGAQGSNSWTRIPLGNAKHSIVRFEKNVGILPIYGPATISTRGLEWDVHDWSTEMGGNMSTSNHVVDENGLIQIKTDRPVLFTVEISLGDFSF